MVSWACQGQALVRPASRRTIKRNTSDSKADQGTSKIIPHYGGSRGTSGLKMVPRVVGERARLLIEAQLGEREVRRTSQWQREAGNLRQNWPIRKMQNVEREII